VSGWEKYVEQAADEIQRVVCGTVARTLTGEREYCVDAARAVLAAVGPLIEEDTRERMVTAAAASLERDSGADVRDQPIVELSRWVDNSPAYEGVSAEAVNWRRITKLVEEAGEVVEAFGGTLAENPRKGRTHTLADVEHELLDVALSALGALAHLRGNADQCGVMASLEAHAESRAARAGLRAVS
jgi:hypothetical protein